MQLVKVLYCKMPTISKQLPTSQRRVQHLNYTPQRWEASVLPWCHCGHPIWLLRPQSHLIPSISHMVMGS